MDIYNTYEEPRSSPKNATSPLNGSEKRQYVNGQDHAVKRTNFYNPPSLQDMCDALRRKSQQKNYKKLSRGDSPCNCRLYHRSNPAGRWWLCPRQGLINWKNFYRYFKFWVL